MKQFTIDQIRKVAAQKGYLIFEDGSPNLWGVRAMNPVVNTFCDVMIDFRTLNGKLLELTQFTQTTDPGSYYLQHPMRANGCGILTEGQHRGMWKLGYHTNSKGVSYRCLAQDRPVTVIRDNNKDGVLDFNSGVTETGMFDILCHRGRADVIEVTVGNWSALCQVLNNGPKFEKEFMPAMILALTNPKWGDTVTYTLTNEKDFLGA